MLSRSGNAAVRWIPSPPSLNTGLSCPQLGYTQCSRSGSWWAKIRRTDLLAVLGQRSEAMPTADGDTKHDSTALDSTAPDGGGGVGGGGGGGGLGGGGGEAGDDVPAKKPRLDEPPSGPQGGLASGVSNETASVTGDNIEQKLRLKKFAMCLMYSGKGYLGMQRNPGTKTIESDLLRACLQAGLVSEDVYMNPQVAMFQRAARTDKGVSAVRQIVSLKLPTTKGTEENMTREINSFLVDQIRVVGLKRVTKNFNAKNNADSRTYTYVMPSFGFAPSEVVVDESYRLPLERAEQANKLLKAYLGCHNFHNFTSGRSSTDPSVMRYIMEADCGAPFLVGKLEYVEIRIKGQSFMLHQIRKMVGLVIAIMRGHTSDDILKRVWGPDKLDIPKAPGLGLMLEQVHYDRYNRIYGGDGHHEELTWTECQDTIHKFKQEHIFPNIWTTEENEESMLSWMSYLSLHSYDVREHEAVPRGVGNVGGDAEGGDEDYEDDELYDRDAAEIDAGKPQQQEQRTKDEDTSVKTRQAAAS